MRRPFVGVLMWTWLGLMNPHRMAWGFSMDLPFALIVFLTTVLSFTASKEKKRIPVSREIVVLIIFLAWMVITTLNARYSIPAWEQWDKVWRIQLGILLTLMLTNSKERVIALAWIVGLSIGFYGLKGGIWTILGGGVNRVYGPPGTFIGGNNEIGLAMVMTAPIIWFLAMQAERGWLKTGMYALTGLNLVAVVGTHSRGALLGVAVMGLMMFFKARNKLLPALLGIVFVAVLPYVAPQEWFDRMKTIETYEEDKSATNRIKAWNKGIDIANARLTGGGFEYLPYSNGVDAHSIYFEVLSEHGYPGLVLFLSLGAMTWFKAGRVRRLAGKDPGLRWADDLAAMTQVSLVGYAVSGAFLGLAYFDLFYVLVVIVVVLHDTVREVVSEQVSPSAQTPASPQGASRTPAVRLAGQEP
jgi:probable O-glycosylation ligase (exosortase A-associated)